MKIVAFCKICLDKSTSNKPADLFVPVKVEINDTGYYEFECREGHHSICILSAHLSQVLFQIACNAVVDGYYREAISSATASLERYYEFLIRVFLRRNKISQEEIEKAWKNIARQSERQLGAFVSMYLSHMQTSPPLLHNKFVELRNKVTHKGEIPNKEVAMTYLSAVHDLCTELSSSVWQEGYRREMQQELRYKLTIANSRVPEGHENVLQLGTNLILGITADEIGGPRKRTFEQLVNQIEFLRSVNADIDELDKKEKEEKYEAMFKPIMK